MRNLSLLFAFIVLFSIFVPQTVSAEKDKYASSIGVLQVVDNNTDITYTGKTFKDSKGIEQYEYTARIYTVPIYNDNGSLVDCSWHQTAQAVYSNVTSNTTDPKGKNTSVTVSKLISPESYSIINNIFSATVNGTAITTTYQGQTLSWNPVVMVDSKEYTAKGNPNKLVADIAKKNQLGNSYGSNVIEWDYGICIRRITVTEGKLTEEYIFNKNPHGTVWIKDNAVKSAGFIWAIAPYAYGNDSTPLVINQYKQVMASEFDKAVYPVTIDPTVSYTSSQWGFLRADLSANWNTVWTDTSSNWGNWNPYGSMRIGSYLDGSNYDLRRSYVYWDTSAIPDTANISAAYISCLADYDASDTDFNIVIQNGQPNWPSSQPWTDDSFDKSHYSGDGGSFNTVNLPALNNWYNINLNGVGLSWINVSGTTKFCLRSSRDIAGTTPVGNEVVYLGYPTYLEVTYTSAGVPTVTTNPATYVTSTTAQLNGYLDADGGEPCTVWFNYSVNGSGTYNVTANQTGKVTGDTFYASLSGLTVNTLYNFSAVAWNSCGKVNGSWLQFDTTLISQAPTGIVCSAGANAISLSWTKGGNTSQTYIRYKVGSYPTGTTDGNAIANQSGSSYYHTGLISGTSYYYRLWGLDGGNFSTTNATSMCSTTAGVINGSINELPVTNTSEWWNDPNESALVNNPLYPTVNLMADSIGIDHNFWWLLLGIGTLVIGGIIVYTRTNKNILLSMIIVILLGVVLSEMGVFPLWVMLVLGFTGIGMSWKELR